MPFIVRHEPGSAFGQGLGLALGNIAEAQRIKDARPDTSSFSWAHALAGAVQEGYYGANLAKDDPSWGERIGRGLIGGALGGYAGAQGDPLYPEGQSPYEQLVKQQEADRQRMAKMEDYSERRAIDAGFAEDAAMAGAERGLRTYEAKKGIDARLAEEGFPGALERAEETARVGAGVAQEFQIASESRAAKAAAKVAGQKHRDALAILDKKKEQREAEAWIEENTRPGFDEQQWQKKNSLDDSAAAVRANPYLTPDQRMVALGMIAREKDGIRTKRIPLTDQEREAKARARGEHTLEYQIKTGAATRTKNGIEFANRYGEPAFVNTQGKPDEWDAATSEGLPTTEAQPADLYRKRFDNIVSEQDLDPEEYGEAIKIMDAKDAARVKHVRAKVLKRSQAIVDAYAENPNRPPTPQEAKAAYLVLTDMVERIEARVRDKREPPTEQELNEIAALREIANAG